MCANQIKKAHLTFFLFLTATIGFLLIFLPGCEESAKIEEPNLPKKIADPYATVGSLAEVVGFYPISVKGIGLVMLPDEIGSAECPPNVREYLKQYILTRTPGKTSVNAESLINSKKTAVVMVEGRIPAAAVAGDIFELKVSALPNTQTTSLSGGKLFTTDMHIVLPAAMNVGASKAMAVGVGPVFINKIETAETDLKTGYVLAGGKVIQSQKIVLNLSVPSFKTTGLIRNRINERFGDGVANAVSDSVIYLTVPDEFRRRKEKFVVLVGSLYIAPNPLSQGRQIDEQIKNLQFQADKSSAEFSLEAIGKSSLGSLEKLLSLPDESVRFSAARCVLNIGNSDHGLKVLREIAQDKNSAYRIEAVKAVGDAAKRKDVIALMSRMVNDDDFEIRFVAYKYLRDLDNITISRTVIAGSFYVDEIYQTASKVIFAARNSTPRIALFGSPISCGQDVFIESADGRIIINVQKDDKYMSVMRKNPGTGELIGPLKCRYDVGDLVRTLGAPLVADKQKRQRPGLEVPYSDIIALLEIMCHKGAIEAEFITSELPSEF